MNPVSASAGTALATHRAGLALAATAAILVSGKVVIVKLLYARGLDAAEVITLRMACAAPLFTAVAGGPGRKRRVRPARTRCASQRPASWASTPPA